MTYRPLDSKREEFRKYLERTGVMDALTKVLVSLYEEENKPDDALTFIRNHLCGSSVESAELDELKKKLEESSAREKQLEAEIALLKGNGRESESRTEGEPGHVEEQTDAPPDTAGEPGQPEEQQAGETPGSATNGATPSDAAAPDATNGNNQEPAAE